MESQATGSSTSLHSSTLGPACWPLLRESLRPRIHANPPSTPRPNVSSSLSITRMWSFTFLDLSSSLPWRHWPGAHAPYIHSHTGLGNGMFSPLYICLGVYIYIKYINWITAGKIYIYCSSRQLFNLYIFLTIHLVSWISIIYSHLMWMRACIIFFSYSYQSIWNHTGSHTHQAFRPVLVSSAQQCHTGLVKTHEGWLVWPYSTESLQICVTWCFLNHWTLKWSFNFVIRGSHVTIVL